MKKIAKLDQSKKIIAEIIEYDPKNQDQLRDIYNNGVFALLVDITDLVPQPKVGWYYDGSDFYDPLAEIEKSMHDYIDSHYPPKWQSYLQMIYVDPNSSVERKAAAIAVGNWIKSIVEGHFKSLVIKNLSGRAITPEDIDWSALFDPFDPHINIMTLPD